MEVVPVNTDEEFIHQPVGPEAVHLQRHQKRAVCQLTIGPLGMTRKSRVKNVSEDERLQNLIT